MRVAARRSSRRPGAPHKDRRALRKRSLALKCRSMFCPLVGVTDTERSSARAPRHGGVNIGMAFRIRSSTLKTRDAATTLSVSIAFGEGKDGC
jgi:hypothetical protein